MLEPTEPITTEALDPEAVRLCLVGGVGPRIRRALLDRFGTADAVFAADRSELQSVEGVGPKLAQRIRAARTEIDVERELDLCRHNEIEVLDENSDGYPKLLREIHDPPGVLFVHGRLQPRDALGVAIIGSRHATRYGLSQAERLAASLARAGLTIVSGLARGIDAAAHRGALETGGRTVAVLGSGLLNMYPPEHVELAEQIRAQGAVISESPPESQPRTGSFPQRNRIISGVSLGVVIVEAGARSGALTTARHAMEQGREVFAVPGRVDNRMSVGCHRLIRDGARLVESADDVLEELGPLAVPAPQEDGSVVRHPAELQLNAMEQRILAAIETEPTTIDDVVVASGEPVSRVLATISVLEMRRLVRRAGGQQILRV